MAEDKEGDYSGLHPNQFFNHFRHNKEITTKTFLNENMVRNVEFSHKIS